MLAHIYLYLFLFRDNYIEVLQRAGTRETEKVTNILSILRDSGRLFLNVTVTLKVCRRLACGAAPEQDCRRLIAASNGHTRTLTCKPA